MIKNEKEIFGKTLKYLVIDKLSNKDSKELLEQMDLLEKFAFEINDLNPRAQITRFNNLKINETISLDPEVVDFIEANIAINNSFIALPNLNRTIYLQEIDKFIMLDGNYVTKKSEINIKSSFLFEAFIIKTASDIIGNYASSYALEYSNAFNATNSIYKVNFEGEIYNLNSTCLYIEKSVDSSQKINSPFSPKKSNPPHRFIGIEHPNIFLARSLAYMAREISYPIEIKKFKQDHNVKILQIF